MATATTTPGPLETLSFDGNASGPYVFTLVAQNVMCAYPISDIYAPASRYLFYALVALTFATLRIKWLSHVFLGAVVTYAACAAINAFIIIARPSTLQTPQDVSIPFIPTGINWTTGINPVKAVVTNTTTVTIQPDAVELDIDPITAIVVTSCLVGLPLQIWSRTMRGSLIIRYMLLVWNMIMLAASISSLIAWPTASLAAPQYRFCYAGAMDPDSQANDGWDPKYWKGSWNASIYNIFGNEGSVWQELSDNCFYPCFNTSQVIRQRKSLMAVVSTRETKFAKLHQPGRSDGDGFAPLIYIALGTFAAAQIFLYLVSVLRLGSVELRSTIHEPHHLWKKRGLVWRQLAADAGQSYHTIIGLCRLPLHIDRRVRRREERPGVQDLVPVFRLLIDVLALIVLVSVFLLSPCIVVAFICWIEWYIRNDGSANESINQVGQWAPLVSVGVVLFASTVYHLLGGLLASPREIRAEIEHHEDQVRKLRDKLERSKVEDSIELTTPYQGLSRSTSERKPRRCSV